MATIDLYIQLCKLYSKINSRVNDTFTDTSTGAFVLAVLPGWLVRRARSARSQSVLAGVCDLEVLMGTDCRAAVVGAEGSLTLASVRDNLRLAFVVI